MAQLMALPLSVSCFSKIQIGFTFLVPTHLGRPRQRAVKCVYVWHNYRPMNNPISKDLQFVNDRWCIAKNGGGYKHTGVAKGLKVPCLFMITEVSIRRIPAYTPQYTTVNDLECHSSSSDQMIATVLCGYI